ncbi:hypothetical protein N2152v2_009900 [Parachlorella kessleri]
MSSLVPTQGCPGLAARLFVDVCAVEALLEAGAKPAEEVVSHAAGLGETSILAKLLAAGGEPSQQALRCAASAGSVAAVQLLVQAGADASGYGAICEAAKTGSQEVVQLLLQEGESPDAEWEGTPALTWAANAGSTSVMRVLLAAGADVERESEHWAKLNGRPLQHSSSADAARVLLEAGAQVQDPQHFYLPLHQAAYNDSAEVVSMLLEAGANVGAVDRSRQTALHMALTRRAKDAVAVLLASGAPVNAADSAGFTPLHLAADKGLVKGMQLLLEAGADVAARDAEGEMTPLQCAVAAGSGHPFDGCTLSCCTLSELVALLLAHGAPVNARDKDGCCALHLTPPAAVAKQLLAAGAQPNAVNDAGQTPLSAALEAGLQDCAAALLEGGAAVHAGALTQALCMPFLRGEWMLALLPTRSISTEQLAEWAEAGIGKEVRHRARWWEGCRDPEELRWLAAAAKQQLVWQVWALRSRLPPELLRLVAAMCCFLTEAGAVWGLLMDHC